MKKIGILILALLVVPFTTVSAESNSFYVNDNNISMTEKQYNYLLNFYSPTYVTTMSQSIFDQEMNKNLVLESVDQKYIKTITHRGLNGEIISNDYEITKDEYENPITTHANCEIGTAIDCWDTNYKKLALYIWRDEDDSTSMRIVLQNYWKVMPAVRSYDVIGVRYNNFVASNAWGDQYVYITSSGYTDIQYSYGGSNMNIKSNGIGISQNIVNNSDLYDLSNRLCIDGHTTSSSLGIYGSYQHATSDVTLDQSKNYTFGNGLGGVFVFNSGIGSKYDNTRGVSYVY